VVKEAKKGRSRPVANTAKKRRTRAERREKEEGAQNKFILRRTLRASRGGSLRAAPHSSGEGALKREKGGPWLVPLTTCLVGEVKAHYLGGRHDGKRRGQGGEDSRFLT